MTQEQRKEFIRITEAAPLGIESYQAVWNAAVNRCLETVALKVGQTLQDRIAVDIDKDSILKNLIS